MTSEGASSFRDSMRSARDEAGALRDDVAEIASELRELLQLETQLARAEADEAARYARRAGIYGAAAAFTATLGAVFVFLTLMFVLDNFMPLWAAALITTLVLILLAVVLGSIARSNVRKFSPVPQRFMRSVREDMEWVRAQTRSSAK